MMKSYAVRPVSFRDFGVYDVDAVNSRAEIVYEGTQAECYAEKARLEEKARQEADKAV